MRKMDINEMHDHLFDLLQVIDQICRENHICYYLDGGTELGAVREKDFIPWDDDMDICVRSEDYSKFRQTLKKHLPEHIYLLEPDCFSPYFYDLTTRIVDDRWLLRDPTEEDIAYNNYQNRVCADIILYCGIPANKIGQKMMYLIYKIIYGMGMHYRYTIKWEKYTALQKLQVKCLSLIGHMYSGKTPNRIFKLHKRLLKLFDANKTGYRFSGNGAPLKVYEKSYSNSWFNGTVNGEIRGKNFPIKSGYVEELTRKYGDYMKPEYDPQKYTTHGVYKRPNNTILSEDS